MGDSGTDTSSTAEDFNSLEVTDTGRELRPKELCLALMAFLQQEALKEIENGYSDGRGNPGRTLRLWRNNK